MSESTSVDIPAVAEPTELEVVADRVDKGIAWLSSHDPRGRFYSWWQAGLTPLSRLPAHEGTPEVAVEWGEWYRAKATWDKLYRRLEQLSDEPSTPPTLPWQVGWTPAETARP
jgi:hypothetical protein